MLVPERNAFRFTWAWKVIFVLRQKAHPALRCRDYEACISRLRGAGVDVSEVDDIPGVRRCHIHDPFGNRIELIGGDSCLASLSVTISAIDLGSNLRS